MIGLYRMHTQMPAEKRWTSMCMEIHPFDHDDCPTPPWCSCLCHQTTKETQ